MERTVLIIAVATLLVLWLLMQKTTPLTPERFSCYPGQRFENGVCVN
jgi:hypothetical protein